MVLPFIRLKGSEAHIILVSESASAKLDKRSLVAYLECFSAIASKFRNEEAIALTVKIRCAIAILF